MNTKPLPSTSQLTPDVNKPTEETPYPDKRPDVTSIPSILKPKPEKDIKNATEGKGIIEVDDLNSENDI